VTGLLKNESRQLNRGFIKRMETGLPFVTCKIAMSIDGKTSMASGQSKWITGQEAGQDVMS
jgi:diaminohydroxyphosphoribosylaminopyrimidine deaminase/5-amino-6-(5-phosphoribosylamino)uracil reductase